MISTLPRFKRSGTLHEFISRLTSQHFWLLLLNTRSKELWMKRPLFYSKSGWIHAWWDWFTPRKLFNQLLSIHSSTSLQSHSSSPHKMVLWCPSATLWLLSLLTSSNRKETPSPKQFPLTDFDNRHDYRGASSLVDLDLYTEVEAFWRTQASAVRTATNANMTFTLQHIPRSVVTKGTARGGNALGMVDSAQQCKKHSSTLKDQN